MRHAELGEAIQPLRAARGSKKVAPIRPFADLSERLEARRTEIEQEILTRVYSVSDSLDAPEPEYVAGLRAAVSAAVAYGLSAIDAPEGRALTIPIELFSQARQAARNGVSLETVLRRYFAGYTLLGDFIVEAAQHGESISSAGLQRVLRAQATVFDRLIAAVAAEYQSESQIEVSSLEQRRNQCVRKLLAGEFVDTAQLSYEIDAWHTAVLASGPEAEQAVRGLAETLDRRLLLVRQGEGALWGWFGGRHQLDYGEIERHAGGHRPTQVSLSVGEPGQGLAGWRLSHAQARAAFPIVQQGTQSEVRYADVALLASMLQDEVLVNSLNEMYLAPLIDDRDGGQALLQTLRAYLATERNTSSTAAALGISRSTVTRRLQAIERRLDCQLGHRASEVEAALRLWEFDTVTTVSPSGNRAH
jgi:DNA-binding phage protein